jgi:centromere protein I
VPDLLNSASFTHTFIRLGLLQQAGNEPALNALLRVYKNYCPDIIVSFTGTGRASSLSVSICLVTMTRVLTNPQQNDSEWRKRLLTIQEMAASFGNGQTSHGGFRVARNGTKRSKTSILPEVHTFHAVEVSLQGNKMNQAKLRMFSRLQ